MIELREQLKGLYLSMSLVGFMTKFDDSDEATSSTDEACEGKDGAVSLAGDTTRVRVVGRGDSSSRKLGRTFRCLYCCSVCCFLWLRVVSYIFSFWVGLDFHSSLDMSRITVTIWLTQCALNVTVILHACLNKNHFYSFNEIWNSLATDYESTHQKDKAVEGRMTYADLAATRCFKRAKQKKRMSKIIEDKASVGDTKKLERMIQRNNPGTDPGAVSVINYSRGGQMGMEKEMASDSLKKEILETPPDSTSTSSLSMAFFDSDSKTGSVRCAWKGSDCNWTEKLRDEGQEGKEIDPRESREFTTKYETKLKSVGRTYTIAAWVVIIINFTSTSLFIVLGTVFPEIEPIQTILTNPFGSSLTARIVFIFIMFVNTCAWILPPAFYCALCSIIRLRFTIFSDVVSKGFVTCGSEFPPHLERWRHEHLRLCQSVTVLERTMRLMLMSVYSTCLPLCIFLLYTVVADKSTVVMLLTNCFWLFVNLSTILIISAHAAAVHEAAHSPLDSLFFVKADRADASQLAQMKFTRGAMLQLQLFVSKLTGPSIGFTALGIVTVTKEMILTIGGLLLTYFIVLLDYQNK